MCRTVVEAYRVEDRVQVKGNRCRQWMMWLERATTDGEGMGTEIPLFMDAEQFVSPRTRQGVATKHHTVQQPLDDEPVTR